MNNKITVKEKSREITEDETLDKIKDDVRRSRTDYDPSIVLEKAGQEIAKENGYSSVVEFDSNTYKAMTLFEFENGILMSMTIAEPYKTFALNFSRDLQKEFGCNAPSEKAIAELATVCYVRTMDIQKKLNGFLCKDYYGELTVKIISVLSKELDRANRQYLGAIQTLKILKQSPMQLSIKANTAVVGQNQIVQTNEHG